MDNIVFQPLEQLNLWEANYREGDLGAIIESIKRFGYNWPVAVDDALTVRAGNHRLKALLELKRQQWTPRGSCVRVNGHGWEIACISLEHLNEDELVAFAIADNRTAELASNDAEALAALLQDLAAQDDALFRATGYDGDDLDALLAELNPPVVVDDPGALVDRAGELQAQWQTERGQLWVIPSKNAQGAHRILCGDSTVEADVARLCVNEIDLVVTDPPYGVSYADKNRFLNTMSKGNRIQEPIENDHLPKEEIQSIWKLAFEYMGRVMRKGAVVYCFMPQGGDQMMMMMMMMMMGAGIEPRHELIWLKNNHVLGRVDYAYKHEPILYAWKDTGHKFYGDFQTSIIECNKPLKSGLHPTTKPVELINTLIFNSSKQNELVYDPFLGSGTTLVACEQTGRIGYGMEIAPEYVAVALQRLADMGLEPRLDAT